MDPRTTATSCHFPEDNTIWSVNSGYGGNVLLGKKCFALRIASYLGRNEGWMAEHMLILGIENPAGRSEIRRRRLPLRLRQDQPGHAHPAGSFTRRRAIRSGASATTSPGSASGEDGRLWAVNPENGFFGVAPGTNAKSNPNALASTQKDTIFTNVVHNLDDNTVWWEGLDKNPPEHAVRLEGRAVERQDQRPSKGAHPNSPLHRACQATAPASPRSSTTPPGVPMSAIVFGGRRAKTAPLVYQSCDWKHGVFVGSIMASETTAAATGAVGVVRRDPMAMLPFCGYNMGDYFAHWLEMGEKLRDKAAQDLQRQLVPHSTDEGNFIWPGFGDNFRVLEWIIKRCEDKVGAKETAIGYVPYADDINLEELDYEIEPGRKFTKADLESILTVEKDYWLDDFNSVKEFYAKIGDTIPAELTKQLNDEIARLSK